MPHRSDAIIDRIKLKNHLTAWRLLTIVSVIALGVVLTENQISQYGHGTGALQGDFIARVTIEDFIYDDPDLLEILEDIEVNKRAKAVVVWLDTPGGSAVGGEEVFLKLRDIAKHKPVVAVMRSMATSAGYMIAIGADRIFARAGTITGSIGVLIETAEVTELAEKLGITPITVKSTPLKGSPGLFEKASPEAVASLQALIDDFYHSFVKMVADRRQFPMEEAYLLADGRVFSGNQAVRLKLIDAIGGEDEAVEWLKKTRNINNNLKVKDVSRKLDDMTVFQQLTETVSRKFFGKSTSSLDGLLSVWHPTH